MNDSNVIDKIKELVEEGTNLKDNLESVSFYGSNSSITQDIVTHNRKHYQEAERWRISTINILNLRLGINSIYSQEFDKAINTRFEGGSKYCKENVSKALGVLEAALSDIKSGLTEDLFYKRELVLFGDLLEQAEEFLSKGFDLAAAIYGRVVLETIIREFANKNNINEKSFDNTLVALKKASIISQPLEHSLRANYAIGSSATHNKEDFEKITKPEIKSFLGFIRDKVLTL